MRVVVESFSVDSWVRVFEVFSGRFFLFWEQRNQVPIVAGGLTSEQLHPRVVGHQGVPASASILAFESTQRVLAVASLYVYLLYHV